MTCHDMSGWRTAFQYLGLSDGHALSRTLQEPIYYNLSQTNTKLEQPYRVLQVLTSLGVGRHD